MTDPTRDRMPRPGSVLLTGFEPFGGAASNPSWDLAHLLDGQEIDGVSLHAALLPVSFQRSPVRLRELVEEYRPQLLVCLGLAQSRQAFSLERVAINLIDARIADNDGCQPVDQPVAAGGPAAFFSSLPVKAMCLALQQAGLPAELSQTAGTFVCNQVMYAALQAADAASPERPMRAGFIHLPWLAAAGGGAALSLEQAGVGLRQALVVALRGTEDVALPMGSVD